MEGTGTDKPERKKNTPGLINQKLLRETTKAYRLSVGYTDKLERKIIQLIQDSMDRASGNRRKTLLARDL